MRFHAFLPALALIGGCSLISSASKEVNVAQVEPLPPERHSMTCQEMTFSPPRAPGDKDLYVCGILPGETHWRCIEYDLFTMATASAVRNGTEEL